MDLLLYRQQELIECLGKVGGMGQSGGSLGPMDKGRGPGSSTSILLDSVKLHVAEEKGPRAKIELLTLLGVGSVS